MMKRLVTILCVVNLTTGDQRYGASQPLPMPYEYGYGVNDQVGGDVKEHYETRLENGRTVGEYRLLQENGLFRVVRYFVDGDSGFQAAVTEEKGEEVTNYAFNSQNGDSKASFRESSNGRSDSNLSGINLDAAASISQPNKYHEDPIEFKNADYESLASRQPFDPPKYSVFSDITSDENHDVSDHIESNEYTFERSHRGANYQPLTDIENFNNEENLSYEDYFEEEHNELSPSQVNLESKNILNTEVLPLCETFSKTSSKQGCISNAQQTNTLIIPLKATDYSTGASENTKHLITISQSMGNNIPGSPSFVHHLPNPLEPRHDDKIQDGSRSPSNFEIRSTAVKLNNKNESETGIFTQNKNQNSFLHHHSFSPNNNKILRSFVSSPTIRVDALPKSVLTNSSVGLNAQSGGLNILKYKNPSNAASTELVNHSLNALKNKKISKQLSILNSKGEKFFLPEIPLDQISRIIVVDGKGSAPRVILDSNKVSQMLKGPNLKSFNPVMFFQNGQGSLSSLNQMFNDKFTGHSPKTTKVPSFESLRSQRNLETLKILADVKNDHHVRKTRQQIIENVLKDMNKNHVKRSENSESFPRGQFFSASHFYSQSQ